jgi:hypothetical protein
MCGRKWATCWKCFRGANAKAQRCKDARIFGTLTCRVNHLSLSFLRRLSVLCVLTSWHLCVNFRLQADRSLLDSLQPVHGLAV